MIGSRDEKQNGNELRKRNKINECIRETSDSDQDPELC